MNFLSGVVFLAVCQGANLANTVFKVFFIA